MKSKILTLIFMILLLNWALAPNKSVSNPLAFVLFVVGYLWLLGKIQTGLDQMGKRPKSARPAGPRAPGEPTVTILTPLRWFSRDVIGGAAGLPVFGALVRKEIRTMLASRKSYWLLFSLSLITSGYFLIFWQNNSLSVTVATRAQFSRRIFSALYLVQYCGLGLVSAVMASATVTTERENKTLDLLLATRLSREQVVLAKWFSNILYQLVLLAALLPIQALAFQLGGVGLDDYLAAVMLVIGAVATYGMIGLAISCHLQRTVPALLATVVVSAVVGLFAPAHLYFENLAPNGGLGAAMMLLVPLGVAFLIAWRIAWHGLAHRDSWRPAIARTIIDDREVLQTRRQTWPYYLIDPLARSQDIADGQDPVYVKEQRISPLGQADVIIRLCYVAMSISFVLVVVQGIKGTFESFRSIACWEAAFLLVFVPVLAATGISKEYEENTIDMLRASPLGAARIVLAKYRVSLRLFAILCLSLTIIPIAFYSGMTFMNSSMRSFQHLSEPLGSLFKVTPMLLGWTALYAATSLLCSSLCRRNITAIVASYVTMLLGLASPWVLGFLLSLLNQGEVLGDGAIGKAGVAALGALRRLVCPLLSPFDFFSSTDPPVHAFQPESWLQIGLCLVLLAGAVVLLLNLSQRLMIRSARHG